MIDTEQLMQEARRIMRLEATEIMTASLRTLVDNGMSRASQLVLSRLGKVVVSGLGKSGLVARRIAAVLCTTGTPAVYLHPVEAMHGDLGVVSSGDVLLMVSRSGETPELVGMLQALHALYPTTPVILITSNLRSPLADLAWVTLDASVVEGADNWGIPTASMAVATALGDALAYSLAGARGVTQQTLHRLHPAGNGGQV